eukprot:TRINITY_DN930_c1_g1_i2.p1 TRINITY_DN930_c1_g1~~TRINITY_DN930_c1_g1_i2.p1  ORF type:complete len:394 (+),score=53.31 TRINITY_DN930_c1_g1_i2:59-1183(+)
MTHIPAMIVPVGRTPPVTAHHQMVPGVMTVSPQRSPPEKGLEGKGKGARKYNRGVTMVSIKDPAVKGNVLYDVSVDKIAPSQGLKEYLEAEGRDEGKRHSHRACICKLWMEGRCGQGTKCKSFHVDPQLVNYLRAEKGVEFDTSFLSELIVQHPSGDIFAVRYTAACKTKGLEAYKDQAQIRIIPFPLCPDFTSSGGSCPKDRSCNAIHIKRNELKEYSEGKQKTPCCAVHGDMPCPVPEGMQYVILQNEHGLVHVPIDRVATTTGATRVTPSNPIPVEALCSIHARSRCKFGRSCTKLHICRDFAKEHGLVTSTPTTPPLNLSPHSRGMTPPPDLRANMMNPAHHARITPLVLHSEDLPQCGSSMPPLMDEEV